MAWMAVALGGAIGSLARHGVNRLASAVWPDFPTGTVVVNLAGCLLGGVLIGLLAAKRLDLSPAGREFLFVGLLGGFTTFSAFGLDTLALARTHPGQAALNVGLQVVGGLVAVWLGYRIAAS